MVSLLLDVSLPYLPNYSLWYLFPISHIIADVPDPPLVETEQISTTLNAQVIMKCSLPDTEPNRLATFTWTKNGDPDWREEGDGGELTVDITDVCSDRYFCTPVNEAGEGPPGTIKLTFICEILSMISSKIVTYM